MTDTGLYKLGVIVATDFDPNHHEDVELNVDLDVSRSIQMKHVF